jgi:probable F420-dependent oxidoreductase
MKFGTTIIGVSLRAYPQVAQAFEANGFESIWVPEHLVFPAEMPALYPYTETGEPPVNSDTPLYDPWVVLGHIAAATEQIRLGTFVYILPLRHPLETARSVVSVDRLSGGRVTLGVGVGWLPEEFDYVGINFAERGRRADAAIAAIRRLWTEDTITVDDGFHRFGPVRFQPKPRQKPAVPIEIGGTSPPALRRAGRLGDGWVEYGSADMADFAAKLAVVHAARADAGRAGPFEVTASPAFPRDLAACRALAEAGATRVIASPSVPEGERLTPDAVIDWAKRFADEVIARM